MKHTAQTVPTPDSPDLAAAPVPFRSASTVALRHRVLRSFYGVAAASSLVAFLCCLLIEDLVSPTVRLWGLAVYAVLTLVCAAAVRLPPAAAHRALPALSLVIFSVLGSLSMVTGWGLAAPGMVFLPLVVGLVCAVAPWTTSRWVTASAVLMAVVVAALDSLHQLPGPTRLDSVPVLLRLSMHLVAIATAVVGGRALFGLMARHLAVAAGRERRFQALLGIAASAYWETDETGTLRHVALRGRQGEFTPLDDAVGVQPWALPSLVLTEEVLDKLRADMETRAVLRKVDAVWRHSDGQLRQLQLSGQPRLDPNGRLLGYWGVARDMTQEHAARQALTLTERRYHDLFLRLPSPLVLHRQGMVLDANPAAATLLGYPSVAAMLGRDLLASHLQPADVAAARARVAQVATLAPGALVQPVRYQLVSTRGELLHVLGNLTRVEAASPDGSDQPPALLTMLLDETATVLAAREQQRTEALFAQVLSISPDVITLTDMANGQYLMVNDSFCRMLGYREDEVLGHSALALGIWRQPADRDGLLALLAKHGAVENLSVEFVAKHGAVVPLLLSAARFERDGRDLLVINARDMTEAAQLRLEREAILANASVGIAFTRDRRFVMVNQQFERIYGWPPGELVGRSGRVVWASESDYDNLGTEIGPALRRGEAVELEREALRQDGSRFLVRLRAKALSPLQPTEYGTIWIAEDVTRARADAQALAAARDAAEAASRAKSAFLANTSHEIRTPLNGLVGLARLARQPGLAPDRRREYIDQIADSAETLSAIISDILDLSKIEAGKLEVMAAPFDLREVLHGLQQAYAALAAGHGLAFALAVDQALPPRVQGDALRTRQILGNFLHNALKFTTQGSIRLVVQSRAAGWVRFEVHDTGPGIAPAVQGRLFQPFSQADDSTTRRYGGTGLGLSICRELATLLGGEVGLHSTPGQGSCFYAELPLPAASDARQRQPDPQLDDGLLRGARVLLVEDNPVNMTIGVALLEQWQVDVTQAADGAAALAAVAQAQARGQPFQAVLMDVQMPDMSGYDATTLLRQQHSAQALPVIALTAAALVSERHQALAVGMNDFITKPVDPQRLREALLRVLVPA